MQILTSENIVDINKFLFAFSASLSSSLSDDLLARATVQVVTNLKNKTAKSEMTRTNIQMIGALRCDMFLTFSPSLILLLLIWLQLIGISVGLLVIGLDLILETRFQC